LWILQESRRAWARQGLNLDYANLTAEAEKTEPFRSLINPNAARFAKPCEMPDNIAAYCRETGQPAPETPGQYTRCILESLALSYRTALSEIEQLIGRSLTRLHIVGGGSQSALLNQFAASAIQREVIAGPAEATAAGNIGIQAIALGQVESQRLAQNARDSFPLHAFQPSTQAGKRRMTASLNLTHNVTMSYKFVNYSGRRRGVKLTRGPSLPLKSLEDQRVTYRQGNTRK
jgi:rhamnulokinase